MAKVQPFYHEMTHTISYLVYDHVGGSAAIIDPALDYQLYSGRLNASLADQQLTFLKQQDLTLEWILETHAHADHLTASQYLQHYAGGKIGIGQGIREVQHTFRWLVDEKLLHEQSFDGVFDHLFVDQEVFHIGKIAVRVQAAPGHTPDNVAYIIEDQVFVGDSLFLPDSGSARCDFPGGDAALLYQSIKALHALDDAYVLWVCHDYQPQGRSLQYSTTVLQSRTSNIHINDKVTEQEFIKMRTERDATLDVPRLIYPAIQVNILGGRLPSAHQGRRFLKQPLSMNTELETVFMAN